MQLCLEGACLNWAAPLQTLQRPPPLPRHGADLVSIGQRRFRRCNPPSRSAGPCGPCLNWAAPLQTLQLFRWATFRGPRMGSQLGSAASDAATRSSRYGCRRLGSLNWAAPLQTLQPRSSPRDVLGPRVSIGQRRFRRCNQLWQILHQSDRASQLGSAASDAATIETEVKINAIRVSQLGSAASDAATLVPREVFA